MNCRTCNPGRAAVLCVTSLALALGGCATASKGGSQSVALKVQNETGEPVNGLNCALSNTYGQWTVVAPGNVEVKRSLDPLMIICEGPAWEMAQQRKVEGNSKVGQSMGNGAATGAGIGILVGLLSPLALIGATATALMSGTAGALYGGTAGVVVDGASGAAFEYAPEITVIVKARVVEPTATVAAAH